MKMSLKVNKRVDSYLKRMEEAMPEIKRQIEVYEKNIQSGKLIKPKIAPQFNNA